MTSSAVIVHGLLQDLYKITDLSAATYTVAHQRRLLLQRLMAKVVAVYFKRLTQSYGSLTPFIVMARQSWDAQVDKASWKRPRPKNRPLNEAVASILRDRNQEAAGKILDIDRVSAEVSREAIFAILKVMEDKSKILQRAEPVPVAFAPDIYATLFDNLRGQTAYYLEGAAGRHAYDVANLIVNAADPKNPKTIPEIRDQVLEQLPQLNRARALTIVRTETARVYGTVAHRVMVENNVQRKRWLTAAFSPAARTVPVCPVCLANAAQGWIPIHDVFQSGDFHPPAHPHCRCDIVGDYINWEPPIGQFWPATDPETGERVLPVSQRRKAPPKVVSLDPKTGYRLVRRYGKKSLWVDTEGWALNQDAKRDKRRTKPLVPPINPELVSSGLIEFIESEKTLLIDSILTKSKEWTRKLRERESLFADYLQNTNIDRNETSIDILESALSFDNPLPDELLSRNLPYMDIYDIPIPYRDRDLQIYAEALALLPNEMLREIDGIILSIFGDKRRGGYVAGRSIKTAGQVIHVGSHSSTSPMSGMIRLILHEASHITDHADILNTEMRLALRLDYVKMRAEWERLTEKKFPSGRPIEIEEEVEEGWSLMPEDARPRRAYALTSFSEFLAESLATYFYQPNSVDARYVRRIIDEYGGLEDLFVEE